MSDSFKRGDLVVYHGHIYYFQPNGRSCHLYDHRADIGKTTYAERSAISELRVFTRKPVIKDRDHDLLLLASLSRLMTIRQSTLLIYFEKYILKIN